ncbi:GntR family transcriptional regulator [Geothrix sp. PMB-07]|uniref:GntR family transcriptional regulator n=1 Tax=Geothrix sp. PMB-07 TaxID=3068640 RepID=UPI0027417BBD|nr:GntR family transcriptional regulator [Geothrix sp. PMB-07]WLT30916.1 GntR family transcriptional regulator [Geothrix sp. PMB-07]
MRMKKAPQPGNPSTFMEAPILQTQSLREQVYDYLRTELNQGRLQPGAFFDTGALSQQLGVSRTPLRDALLQLEAEGLVEILPRRGFRVKTLTLEEIRHIYQVVGALESAAIASTGAAFTKADLAKMKASNKVMIQAIKSEDYALYYDHNTAFHSVFLDRCANPHLTALVQSYKHRLYYWPLRKVFLKAWEERSVKEHEQLITLLEAGDVQEAVAYHRDVHWSFENQEAFIRIYYFTDRPD